MAEKSLILDKQGVAHTVLSLMHEDISPKDAAEMYAFASPELKQSFIEGLTWGQTFVQALRRYLEFQSSPGRKPGASEHGRLR